MSLLVESNKSAWINERRLGIGGSEVAILLGVSPWRTPYSLWLEKTGRQTPDDISNLPHVARGVRGEIAARALLEAKYVVTFKPKTWVIDGTPYRCSDDGYSFDLNTILEIKCMSAKAHEEFKKTLDVPRHYYLQCQWNLFVSKAARCLFVSYNPETEELVEKEILPNEQEHQQIIKAVDEFWDLVQKDIPPSLSSGDYEKIEDKEFEEDCHRYAEIKQKLEELKQNLTELEIKLHTRCGSRPGIMGSVLKVTRYQRKGAVDYGKISGVDFEQYRKPSTICYKISLLK